MVSPILINNTLVWVDKEKGHKWLSSAKSNSQAIAAHTLNNATKVVENFENPKISEEKIDYRFRDGDGETGDIWKDHSLGLEERLTNAALRMSNNQSGDLTLRNDAMRAIGGNLTSLRKAMAAQRRFDQSTVKRVSDLARILMQNGYLSGITSGEMQRLLSAVKNATASHDISDSVQKIIDIMVNNQLRNAGNTLRQMLSIRGSKVDFLLPRTGKRWCI